MADQVTPPAEKSPEEIEREMHQTRESLTEKVAALETQVVGTVQTAADTITGTVEAVTNTVKHATAAVSETVKETFDITGHVRRHPWAAVGLSALLGSIVGCLTVRRREVSPPGAARPPVPAAPPAPAASRSVDEKPGVIDEFVGMLGDKAKEMARTALETVSSAIKQHIESGVPKLVDDAASHLTDAVGSGEPTFAGGFDTRRSGV